METVPFCVVFRFIGQHAVPGAKRSFLRQMFSYGLHAVPETKRRLFLGRRRFRMFLVGIVSVLRKMLQFGIAIIVHIC